jgi:hypothetical protein
MAPRVVAVLHDAFRKAMFDPQFLNEIAKYDQELDYLDPAGYAKACREIFAKERAAADRFKSGR